MLTIGVAMLATSEPSGLRTEKGTSILVGELVAADEDGYVRMELSCGGLDVEVSGDLPIVHRRYRIAANDLRVFDCDY